MPKRKLEDSDSADTSSDVNPLRSETPPRPQSETDESSSFSAVTDSSVDVPSADAPRPKKKKKSVNFDKVTVYYFPRTQGFTCVPSEGGSTLGMTGSHSYMEDFTVSAYAREMKRIHKLILKEQQQSSKVIASNRAAFLRSVEEDSDSESDSESDFEVDEYFFLQPVPIRQRRLMLRAAGVRKINSHERDDCRQIRLSREICGCQCKVFCDPESCSCSVAGIKCQVDRLSFPCGCSKDGCGNVAGRIEFNPIRVRTHFIHTLMRIELENKDKECHTFGNKQLSISDSSAANKDSDSEDKDDDDDESKNKKDKDQSIDLADYNSNERGSCRDCQNSEVCQVMMQEAQYASMEAEQQNAVQQYGHGLQANGHVEALPRHLLFNDSDDEMYSAESTSLYAYKQEESSYSETSECSSESSANLDDNDYQKSFQSLSSFDEETNQEYCASGSASVGADNVSHCQPSQMQQQHNNNNNNNHISNSKTPHFSSSNNNNNNNINNNHLQNGLSQKYIDLNSSSSNPPPVYKLEPVSHIMNRLDNNQHTFNGQVNGHSRFDAQSNGHNGFDGQSNGHNGFARQTNGFSSQANGHNVFAQSNDHRTFNGQNVFNNQSNNHNTFHSQSNGHCTFNGQPNGRNVFQNHSNNHNTFSSQSHNIFNAQSSDHNTFNAQSSDHNTFNTQSNDHNTFNAQSSDHNTFNSQNTFVSQSNGPNSFTSQSNGPNSFSSQSNGPSLFNSQSNGSNQFANQSNGPIQFGNTSNNHRSFENQSTQPLSHSTSNWSGDQSRSIHQSSFFDEPISIYTSLTDTTTDQLATNCPAISSHMNNYNGNGNHQLDFNHHHQGADTSKMGDIQNQPEAAFSSYSMDDSHNTATSSAMSTSDQSLISSFFPSNTTESDLVASSSGSSATSMPPATEDLQMFSEQESCSSAFQEETCKDIKSNKDSSHFQTTDSGSQNFGEIIKESIVETVSA